MVLFFVFYVPLWLIPVFAFDFAFSAAFSSGSAGSGTANCAAADTREPLAALVPFQRQQPSDSRHHNANSAIGFLKPACHFGG